MDDAEQQRLTARQSLERYMHYWQRWAENDKVRSCPPACLPARLLASLPPIPPPDCARITSPRLPAPPQARKTALQQLARFRAEQIEALSERTATPTSQLKFVEDAFKQVGGRGDGRLGRGVAGGWSGGACCVRACPHWRPCPPTHPPRACRLFACRWWTAGASSSGPTPWGTIPTRRQRGGAAARGAPPRSAHARRRARSTRSFSSITRWVGGCVSCGIAGCPCVCVWVWVCACGAERPSSNLLCRSPASPYARLPAPPRTPGHGTPAGRGHSAPGEPAPQAGAGFGAVQAGC